MPSKGKLYASESAFDSAVASLETRFSLSSGTWCSKEIVGNGDDKDKFILPLPAVGKYKADHLFDGVVDFNGAGPNEE